MSDVALPGSIEPAAHKGPDLSGAINPITGIIFGGVIAGLVAYGSVWALMSWFKKNEINAMRPFAI